MTDLTTTHLQHLLDRATPGHWTVKENKWDETIVGNSAGHARALGKQVRFLFEAGHPEADTELVALAPQLAGEVLWMRKQLASMRKAWLSVVNDSERMIGERILANHAVQNIDYILGETSE